MAFVTINEEHLTDIADAIRHKAGTDDTYKPREMASAIYGITGDSGSSTVYKVSPYTQQISNGAFCNINYSDDMYIPCGISLSKVVVPENAALRFIGDFAFRNQSLTSMNFTQNVGSIGQWAFANCINLKEVDLSATEINTFAENSGSNFSTLGGYQFCGCKNLTKITLPPNLKYTGEGLLKGCSSITTLELPSTLLSIGQDAFSGLGITELVIPESVQRIDPSAFASCTSLKTVRFLGTPRYMESSTIFFNCPSIQMISVPWGEGDILNAPWGATNAVMRYGE